MLDKWELRAGGAVTFLLASCAICAGAGWHADDRHADPSAWYSAAEIFAVLAAIGVLLMVMYPITVMLSRWTASEKQRLQEVRSKTKPAARGPKVEPLAPVGDVEIIKARYGNAGKWNVVTDIVRSHVIDGKLQIHVTNQVMGGDPLPNIEKQLWVHYRFGESGEIRQIWFPEDDPNEPDPGLARLP